MGPSNTFVLPLMVDVYVTTEDETIRRLLSV